MPTTRLPDMLCRSYRKIVPELALFGAAVLLAVYLTPLLTATASQQLQSPISPISSPVAPTVLPPARERTGIAESPTPLPENTAAATATTDTAAAGEEILQELPPPPPLETPKEPTTPPTLWIVIGLAAVGGIVAGLIVFRKN